MFWRFLGGVLRLVVPRLLSLVGVRSGGLRFAGIPWVPVLGLGCFGFVFEAAVPHQAFHTRLLVPRRVLMLGGP